MPAPPDYWKERWKAISPSGFAWEQEALDYLRQHLGHPVLRVWTNFEFITPHGAIYEVDALVLTTTSLFVVEIKSWPGTLTGDAHTWTVQFVDGGQLHTDNPVLLVNRKAKALKGLLLQQDALRKARGVHLPYVDGIVFLSHPAMHNRLPEWAGQRVYTRDVRRNVVTQPLGGVRSVRTVDVPGILAALVGPSDPAAGPSARLLSIHDEKVIVQALEQAGIRTSNRARRVGDYILEALLEEGPGYQDRLARHASMEGVQRRIRQYVVSRASSRETREHILRAARREFQLVESLVHPGILRARDYNDHELGPALIFDYEPEDLRLDHYLQARADRLDQVTRLNMVRQVAEALRYAHSRKIVHRGLSPQSILVHETDPASPELKIMNWQTGMQESGSRGTVHVQDLVESAACAYLSPEALTSPDLVGEHSDVFSLGSVAFHILTGQAPADSRLTLEEVLRDQGGFHLSAALDGTPKDLDDLIHAATAPDVTRRIETVADFLTLFDDAERKLLAPEGPVFVPAAEAREGDLLEGGFVVKRRLGRGSVAQALLVEREGEEFVLKIAHGPQQNPTLQQESEVLAQLRNRHVVELVETVSIGSSTALVLRKAGTETLADRLKAEGHLGLEMLERFGTDLLTTVTLLEARGIPHRDLKPANLGVAEMGKSAELHLVLFDFSLSRAPAENIRAGTPPYLDPFLSQRKPARWDLQAERYSAAVTLYEMATGVVPRWGDGQSDPALVDAPLQLESERFDPAVRETLTAFFARGLHRDPAQRFDNAEEMRLCWVAAFARTHQELPAGGPPSADLEAALAGVDIDTPLSSLPLGPHVAQALDRLDVLTVLDLLQVPLSEIWAMRGVGNHTRRRIAHLVAPLARRFPDVRTRARTEQPLAGDGDEGVPEVDGILDGLVGAKRAVSTRDGMKPSSADARGGLKGKVQAALGRAILGLDSEGRPAGSAWMGPADLGSTLRMPVTQVREGIDRLRRDWKADRRLAGLRVSVREILGVHGGVMAADDLAQAVLVARVSRQNDAMQRTAEARAVTRAALEAEQAESSPGFVLRRTAARDMAGDLGGDGRCPSAPAGVAEGPLLVALSPDLADYAEALGWAADGLAVTEPLVPPQRVLQELRAIPPPPQAARIPTHRLLKLAASASRGAAVSSRQELYPRGMEARRALILAQASLLGEIELKVEDIRARVAARYPEAQPLPDGEELARMFEGADWGFAWSEERGVFHRPPSACSLSGTSTGIQRRSTTSGTPAPMSPEVAEAKQLDQRLSRAARDGAFLALMVRPGWMRQADDELCQRFDLERCSLDAMLLGEMRRIADERRVRWDLVLEADAKLAGPDWDRLLKLVDLASRGVEERILASPRTVLLVHPGLLARYDRMDVLERLRDYMSSSVGSSRLHGLWVLLACDEREELPVLDGKPVPLLTPGQRARLGQGWLENWHRAASLQPT